MKIAFLTTDNREQLNQPDKNAPFFGTAPEALLNGFTQFPNEIEVHVISCATRAMETPVKLADNIWFHQPIVPKIGWGRTAFLGCALAVRRLLKEIKPDIIHAQGTERDCGVSMMLAPSAPCLLTIHGHMARIAEIVGARFPSYYWMVRTLESMAVRRADGVVAITHYTQDRVNGSCREGWVVPNAVDASFFDVIPDVSSRIAMCVGSICPWKRQVELIEALDRLPQETLSKLVFLGGVSKDDYSKRFLELVAERPWCHFEGFADRQTIMEHLSQAAMLILPSTEDNCPMVILEAMAAGVPVAASRIGGIPDLVDDGATGLLFDPRKPDEMATAICRMMESPEFRSSCSVHSKRIAKERFSPTVIAAKHLEIYRQFCR
jgi:glycosyltransferase involved in cell wall biosynthesis